MLLATRLVETRGQEIDFQATGFVISKARRLVATAGHVADVFSLGKPLTAILDGTTAEYRVERAWYHPAAIRELDDCLFVRSNDPLDGAITWCGHDVAVLQLSMTGPPLPYEMTLANEGELNRLEGQSVGFLGYPVAVENRWPSLDRPCSASFSPSVIVKTTDGELFSEASPRRRYVLWYAAGLGPGSSGSPLFLENGHVAGIVRGEWEPRRGHYRGQSMRIDTIIELMNYHHLIGNTIGKVSGPMDQTVEVSEPRLRRLRNSVTDIKKAARLRRNRRYEAAYTICSSVLAKDPDYGRAWVERAEVSLWLLRERFHELSESDRKIHSKRAYDDMLLCVNIYPWWNRCCVAFLESLVYFSLSHGWDEGGQIALAEEDALSLRAWPCQPLNPHEMARMLVVRAHAFSLMGDDNQARRAFSDAITLAPNEPSLYLDRANYWQRRRLFDRAKEDRCLGLHLMSLEKPTLPLPSDSDDPFREESKGPANPP